MAGRAYRPVRLWLAPAFLALVSVICLALMGALRARMLISTVLDGRRIRIQETIHLPEFYLKAQMYGAQAASKMNGWMSVMDIREETIRTQEGRRYARIYPPIREDEHAPWALVFHGGLGTDHTQVQDVACELSLAGYRVVAADLASHGQSEGKWTSLGLREKEDVKAWVNWILACDPAARIVIFGQDEGAVAALLAAGEGLPDAVAAVAADSAYLHVQERVMQMLAEMQGEVSAADRWLMNLAYRTVFDDAAQGNVAEAASRSRIPLLLLYGTGDEETPAWHGEDIAEGAGEGAQLCLIEGAVHGMARYGDPQTYYETLMSFYDNAIK